MENIWEILKTEQTKDRAAIRRAYAALAKKYNPEEHPEEFLRIREAYEKAMAFARGDAQASPSIAEGGGTQTSSPMAEADSAPRDSSVPEPSGEEERFSWDFTEDSSYSDHGAILKFRELYTGKRRKDRNAWADYFTSEDFLEVFREEGFTLALLNTIRELKEEYPLCREFLTELYITYGLTFARQQVVPAGNAAFYGIEHIIEIALMGPSVRFKGNDPALAEGFRDYRELVLMAMEENWDADTLLRLGKLIDRYTLGNISDRPIMQSAQYELYQRHPRSLRLLAYFFAHTELPAQAYRLLWSHLYLENATMGKEKLFYGALRQIVLDRAASVTQIPKLDYRQLIHDYTQYCISRNSTEQEQETAEEFLSREDIQRAMMDETFVDRQILPYWVTKSSTRSFVELLEKFYTEHADAPFRRKILENTAAWKRWKQVDTEFQEDEASAPVYGNISLGSRPMLRYYLNTAFHLAQGVQYNVYFPDYLSSHFPYSVKWSRQLVSEDGGGFTPDRPLEISFGEHILQIILHARYIEYRWDGQPFGPMCPWETTGSVEDDTMFWMLLPLTKVPFREYETVYKEIKDRLSRLPVHEEELPVIADCIAGSLCIFEGEEDSRPICTFYEETEEKLYGCDIYNNGTLFLYEETIQGKMPLPGSDYHAPDMDSAVRMAKRLLTELTSSYSITASIANLPEMIRTANRFGPVRTLEGEQVTDEALRDLMEQYFGGKIRRLELTWPYGSLVFLNQDGRYACMFFDKWKMNWYALVGMPEVYATVESADVVYVPYGLGMLPDYLIHRNPTYMKSILNDIFSQIAGGVPQPKSMMWSPHAYRFEVKLQYHLAKCLFGGYPPEEVENQIADRFYIPQLPDSMEYMDLEQKTTGPYLVGRDKKGVQDMLSLFMSGRLLRLVLTWKVAREDPEAEESVPGRRHLILLQDQGNYQMAYLDEASERLEYLVADVQAYMKAEGKKFEKTSFNQKTVPAYLVHGDLRRIRNYLDLLISQIRMPYAILGRFGEFSHADRREYTAFVENDWIKRYNINNLS